MKNLSMNVINCALSLKQLLVWTLKPFKNHHLQTEYGRIINASEISNGDDAIADVWNEYDTATVPNKTR